MSSTTVVHLGAIRQRDTDVLRVQISPPSSLAGSRVRAKLWVGPREAPLWSYTWDSIAPEWMSIDPEEGELLLGTGGASWENFPKGEQQARLEVDLFRGGTLQTLNDMTVTVMPKAQGPVDTTDPTDQDPVDGTLTEVWVDGDAGTDLATGSEDDPLRTIGRALELLADGDATIWLRPRAGGAAYDSRPLAKPRTRRGLLYVRATPDSWEEWAAPFELNTSTSTRVMIVASSDPGWGENTARGAILEIVESSTPALVGQRRTILRNTSDTAWVGMGFSANIPAGTQARIIRPSVVLEDEGDGKNVVYLGELYARAGLALEGVVFSSKADQWEFVGSGSLFGCEVRSVAVFYSGRAFLGITAAPEPLPGVPWQALAGCGIAVHGLLAATQYELFAVATCVGATLANSYGFLYGFSSLGAANGLTVQACYLILGSAGFFGGPKAPVFVNGTTRWLDLRGSEVLFRSRVEQIGTSTELRIGERSHANVQNPDLIVTAGAIRAQEDSSYRIDGVPARNSPPGGGFLVGESSFQLAAPDLNDNSLPNKGRLVNPIDGSRIYWAISEPT